MQDDKLGGLQYGTDGPRFADGVAGHRHAVVRPGHRGARQDSCRLIHAANGCLFASPVAVAMTASRSGLRGTAPMGDQSRIRPDHRAGWRSRAARIA